jgi:hypothetical protein
MLPQLRVDRQPSGKFDPITVPLDDGFYASFPDAAKAFKIQRDDQKHEIDITSGITINKAPCKVVVVVMRT